MRLRQNGTELVCASAYNLIEYSVAAIVAPSALQFAQWHGRLARSHEKRARCAILHLRSYVANAEPKIG